MVLRCSRWWCSRWWERWCIWWCWTLKLRWQMWDCLCGSQPKPKKKLNIKNIFSGCTKQCRAWLSFHSRSKGARHVWLRFTKQVWAWSTGAVAILQGRSQYKGCHHGTTAGWWNDCDLMMSRLRGESKFCQAHLSAVEARSMGEPAMPQRSSSQKKHKVTEQRPENIFPHHCGKVVKSSPTTRCSVGVKMAGFWELEEGLKKYHFC